MEKNEKSSNNDKEGDCLVKESTCDRLVQIEVGKGKDTSMLCVILFPMALIQDI